MRRSGGDRKIRDKRQNSGNNNDSREGEVPNGELKTFRRRVEWWREYHGDASGVVSGELRRQAIAHAERLAADGLPNPDPGGTPPRSGFEVTTPPGISKPTVTREKNPRPRSSLGFASSAVEVRGSADLRGAILKIALDSKPGISIEPATIRIFRFDETSREWQLLPRSGATDRGYAWAHLHRPGLYIAIGLQADAVALRDLLTLRALMPRLRATQDRKSRRDVLELLDKLFQRPAGESKARQRLRTISGLDISARGLPEFDLLNDLYQHTLPPPGKAIGAEIITRLRLNDIVLDLDNLILFNGWVSVGPRNFSGRIKSLAIHPVEGNGLLAGAADGGVWRTQEGGEPWYPLMSQELSMAIGSVARSQSNLAVIYAATGEDTLGQQPSYPGVGLYKSIDGGSTWSLLAPIQSSRCTRVLIHPGDANTVYVSGDAGLDKSTDGGATWTKLRSDHVSDMVMDPIAPNTIYAGVYSAGVFRTTDGGENWSDFNEGLPTGSAAGWIKLAASDADTSGVVTLVAKMGANSAYLFTRRMHVPIVTNTKLPLPTHPRLDLPWQAVPGTHEGVDYNGWTNLVAIDPTRTGVLFAGGAGLQRSGDGGATFSQIKGTHADHHALVFARSNNDLCYMATDGGVSRSVDNGVTWTLCSTGLVATQLYTIGVSEAGPFLLGGSTQDQGIIATNGSADWFDTGAGTEGGIFIVDPNNSRNVYVTPWFSNLRRSTNGGSDWTTIVDGITQTGSPPQAVTVQHIAVCPTDSNLLLCCAGGAGPDPSAPQPSAIFRSTDQGTHWSLVFTFPDGVAATRVVWYGGNTCYATSRGGDVVRSQQQGAVDTWSQPYASVDAPPRDNIIAIEARFLGPVIATVGADRATAVRVLNSRRRPAPVPFNMDLVYIAYSFGRGVYKSTDGGIHWSNASGGGAGALPNIPISALVIDRDFSDTVYVATDIGVFRTRDGGANWEPFNDGLPRVLVSGLALRRTSNTLYASTMGRGAYQRALS
jgi:photosystem II stability/assembly factor-like uncharacterized protein